MKTPLHTHYPLPIIHTPFYLSRLSFKPAESDFSSCLPGFVLPLHLSCLPPSPSLSYLLPLFHTSRLPMFSPPVTFYGATAIYLSSYFLIHILSSNFRVPYLHSEWLCWSFLLFAAKLLRPSKDDDQDATTQSDKLALAIAAVCAFRTIGGVDWALVRPCFSRACAPAYPLVHHHSHYSRPCRY